MTFLSSLNLEALREDARKCAGNWKGTYPGGCYRGKGKAGKRSLDVMSKGRGSKAEQAAKQAKGDDRRARIKELSSKLKAKGKKKEYAKSSLQGPPASPIKEHLASLNQRTEGPTAKPKKPRSKKASSKSDPKMKQGEVTINAQAFGMKKIKASVYKGAAVHKSEDMDGKTLPGYAVTHAGSGGSVVRIEPSKLPKGTSSKKVADRIAIRLADEVKNFNEKDPKKLAGQGRIINEIIEQEKFGRGDSKSAKTNIEIARRMEGTSFLFSAGIGKKESEGVWTEKNTARSSRYGLYKNARRETDSVAVASQLGISKKEIKQYMKDYQEDYFKRFHPERL